MVQHLQYLVYRYYNSIPICFHQQVCLPYHAGGCMPICLCKLLCPLSRYPQSSMSTQFVIPTQCSFPTSPSTPTQCGLYISIQSSMHVYLHVSLLCLLILLYISIYLLWLLSGLVYCGYLQHEYLVCFTFLIGLLCLNNLLNVLFFHALLVSFNNIKPILSNRTHIKFIVLQSLARETLFIKRVY